MEEWTGFLDRGSVQRQKSSKTGDSRPALFLRP